jgi:hypothetical protein
LEFFHFFPSPSRGERPRITLLLGKRLPLNSTNREQIGRGTRSARTSAPIISSTTPPELLSSLLVRS